MLPNLTSSTVWQIRKWCHLWKAGMSHLGTTVYFCSLVLLQIYEDEDATNGFKKIFFIFVFFLDSKLLFKLTWQLDGELGARWMLIHVSCCSGYINVIMKLLRCCETIPLIQVCLSLCVAKSFMNTVKGCPPKVHTSQQYLCTELYKHAQKWSRLLTALKVF